MEKIDWKEILGWQEDQIEEMKFFGFSYLRQGKYDIALKIFQALNILVPQDPYVLKTLGALLVTTQSPEKALDYLYKAEEMDPTDPQVKLNIAQSLLDLGQKEDALEKIKKLTSNKNKKIAGKAKALLMGWG